MLLIDMNNLCMREAFAKAGLTHRGRPSGVVYGVMQQIKSLIARFPGEVCCCWDAPRKTLHRRQFWAGYKANRDGKEPQEAAQDAYPQMVLLREELLPRLGLPNQFLQIGYEADDLIAELAINSQTLIVFETDKKPYLSADCLINEQRIIVSSDNDLYQLLGPRVFVYDLGKKANYSWQNLQADHGVLPGQWAEVKAIAGDSSDGIDGVPGVGIKTAVRYLTGKLGPGKVVGKILDCQNAGIIDRNRTLVRLPWPGCDPGRVQSGRFNEREFMRVCTEWGLRSLG